MLQRGVVSGGLARGFPPPLCPRVSAPRGAARVSALRLAPRVLAPGRVRRIFAPRGAARVFARRGAGGVFARRGAGRVFARRGARRVFARRPAARISAPTRAPRVSERGQASVEFVALLPLIVLALFAAWQFLLAGDALWNARTAARAAARANAVGGDPREAARDHLPGRLERELRVAAQSDGDVRVSIRIPAIIHALDVGRVAATAHFARQQP